MTLVKLQGGLGNQLFQAVTGFLASRVRKSDSMILDASEIPYGSNPDRRLEIENIDIFPSNFKVEIWGRNLHKYLKPIPNFTARAAAARLTSVTRDFIYCRRMTLVHDMEKDKIIDRSISNLILKGYFIDFSLVEQGQEMGLSRQLNLKQQYSGWLIEKLFEIDFERSIAIHVRLGDYLKFPKVFGSISEAFYLESLKLLGYTASVPIYIFSDQPNRVFNFLPKISNLENVVILRPSQEISSPEVLLLLSRFRRIVCANSTFSMWGAWFNDKVNGVNKQVVIPTPYLLDSPDISTPAGWLKLSREFVE